MRRNLDALGTEIYNAVSNWNDFTENENGDTILTESEVGQYANSMHDLIVSEMREAGLV